MYKRRSAKNAEYLMKLEDAKASQAKADYYAQQIEQAKIKAPFDGKILTGDLRDKVHSVFKLGDPLMEMAERTQLRAEIAVHERDIQDVHRLADRQARHHRVAHRQVSISSSSVSFRSRQSKEGGNFFKVYGTLDKTATTSGAPAWRAKPASTSATQPRLDLDHRFVEWVQHEVVASGESESVSCQWSVQKRRGRSVDSTET